MKNRFIWKVLNFEKCILPNENNTFILKYD